MTNNKLNISQRIISLSLSVIEADNRVIRQCDALQEAGFDVIAFGLPCEDKRQSGFSFKIFHFGENNEVSNEISNAVPKITLRQKLTNVHRNILYFLKGSKFKFLELIYSSFVKSAKIPFHLLFFYRLYKCKLGNLNSWQNIYWRSPFHKAISAQVEQNLGNAVAIIANDWQMLPIAALLAEKYNLKLIYDSHEHAISENGHQLLYRLLKSAYVFELEKECLSKASLVMSVSTGIVSALKKQYGLLCRTIEIKSTPYYFPVEYKPVNPQKIVLYYHGYLKENRNLELILLTLEHLDPKYTLVFRGGHDSSKLYELELLKTAKDRKLDNRFSIEPMASHEELFQLANQADIGLVILPTNTLHFNMALPNKFFEYLMAGLAIGVSSLKEMGDYVNEFDLGFVLKDASPETLAKEISNLSIDKINMFKRNSLSLARTMSWENEKIRLQDVVKEVLSEN